MLYCLSYTLYLGLDLICNAALVYLCAHPLAETCGQARTPIGYFDLEKPWYHGKQIYNGLTCYI